MKTVRHQQRKRGGRSFRKVNEPKFDLRDLVERIHPSNVHESIDFGRALGKEKLTPWKPSKC
jgi:hypothetical protein